MQRNEYDDCQKVCDLGQLHDGVPNLIPQKCANDAMSAVWCLRKNGHQTPCRVTIKGAIDGSLRLAWEDDERIDRSYGNHTVTIGNGACAIAYLCIEYFTEYSVLQESYIGSGVDFFAGDGLLMQNAVRIEVSGILAGPNKVSDRQKAKRSQTAPSDDWGMPVFVIVVEFSEFVAHVEYYD